MKILLSGFMGSGKTTLLNRLKNSNSTYDFLDLDEELLKNFGSGFSTLGEAIEAKGWEEFRNSESIELKNLLASERDFVLSLGGGALENSSNLEQALKTDGLTLVFLATDFETCWQRISSDKGRPLVKKGREALEKLYGERLSTYQKAPISLDNDAQAKIQNLDDLLALL